MKLMIEMPDKEAALQAACNAGLLDVHGTTSPEREDWIYEIVKAVIKSATIEEIIGKPREPDSYDMPIHRRNGEGHALYGA